jgi:hypothetical protein
MEELNHNISAIFDIRPLYTRRYILFCSSKNKMGSEKTKVAKDITKVMTI